MLEVYNGAPAERRDEVENRVYECLARLDIPFTRVDHKAAFTMEDCAAISEALEVHICKNLLLTNRQMTDVYLLLMPGDKPFKTKLLSKQIGTARLSFASPEHMQELLDITPGSVSVLGLMNDGGKVHLVIDSDLLKDEFIGCHPCINTSTLKIKTADMIEKFLPEVGHEYAVVELPWEVE